MASSLTYRRPVAFGERSVLNLTDLGILFGLFLAVMYAMDPFSIYIDKRTVFKHFHLMLIIPFFVLAWFGVRLNVARPTFEPVTPILWPLMLLAVWIIGGALYARLHSKIIETFLIMGSYMLVTAGAARFIADHRDPERLLNRYLALLFGAILIGAAWQAGYLRLWSKFHEMEALTVPLAAFFFVRAKSPMGRAMSLVLMLVLMLLVIKNTSFLVTGIALAYLWWCFVRPRLRDTYALGRMLHFYGLAVLGVLVVASYAAIKWLKHDALPDGNPKYRLFTYERTWADFTHSPIWGKSFSGAGAEQFGQFQVAASTQVLPSHSDLLDILGQGGLIGMLLFGFALWRIGRYVYVNYRARRPDTLSRTMEAHFHWLALSCLASIPVVAFNPIMLQPGKAFLLWMNVGIVLGIAMRCRANREAVNPT
ncbi:hypothetical protein ASC95_25765 [Pelomonas sp. Root1217]|nr:hypothetical protein ASC95_25765 [Pelomonas sp. Root1217]